jgi:integrase
MAAIQRRNGRYRARVIRKGYPTFSKTFQTHKEALSWSRLIETQIDKGEINPSKPHGTSMLNKKSLFSDVVELYIKTHSVHKKNYKSEAGILNILSKRWAGLSISEVTKPKILELRDDLLRAGRANNTINHYFNAVSKLFQMLENEFEVKLPNVIKGIRRMPPTPGRNKRINTESELQLLSGCDQLNMPILKNVIEFAIQTGMRRGEIIGLTWANIDIPNRKAYLHKTKNGDARQVPLTLRAIELLQALPKTEVEVFPMTFDCLRSQFKRLRSYLEQKWNGHGTNPFNDLRFHDFRHEALSRLSDAGLNVIELSHIGGHKTLAMLKRYTHPSHEAIFLKLDKLT